MITAADPLADSRARWARTTSVLAIDPGARTGWALFVEPGGWHLAACGVVRPTDMGWDAPFKANLVVIENPQIYPRSPVPPKDILVLARTVGRYEERFAGRCKRLELVAPRDWKGSVSKEIMLARIEAALSAPDRAVMTACLADVAPSYRNNAVDAIGLAKWVLRQKTLMVTPLA